MTHVQGVSNTITNRVLRTLNGKICNEMYKIFEDRGDEIYGTILKTTFSQDKKNDKSYKDEIYKICLEETKQIFDPNLYKTKIIEGIMEGMKKNNMTNPRLTQKYKELKRKERETKSPFRKIYRNVTTKMRSGQLKRDAKTALVKGVVSSLKTIKSKESQAAAMGTASLLAKSVIM
jgi:hypothetical protein